MLVAFLVILIDLIGFGIMVPIFAFYVLAMGGTAATATTFMALYSVGMIIATPLLGRLSDYYGRKPVLALSMAGACAGYLILAFADSLWMIALSRLFSGLMAGNISAAQAYITDVTSIENRAKGMGMIGAAFGLGFIIGPAVGGWLAGDSFENANLFLPAIVSAGMSGTALLCVLFFLRESLDPAHREALRRAPRVGRLTAMSKLVKQPVLLQMVIGGLLYNICAGLVETIFPIWVSELGIVGSPRGMVPILFAGGIVLALVQGGLIGPLTRALGEMRLAKLGCLIFVVSNFVMLAAGLEAAFELAMAGMVLQSGAAALIITSLQSLTSQQAPATERGLTMGVYNSAGTLGRIVGTVLTGFVFSMISPHGSWVVSALVITVLFFLIRQLQMQEVETAAEQT